MKIVSDLLSRTFFIPTCKSAEHPRSSGPWALRSRVAKDLWRSRLGKMRKSLQLWPSRLNRWSIIIDRKKVIFHLPSYKCFTLKFYRFYGFIWSNVKLRNLIQPLRLLFSVCPYVNLARRNSTRIWLQCYLAVGSSNEWSYCWTHRMLYFDDEPLMAM